MGPGVLLTSLCYFVALEKVLKCLMISFLICTMGPLLAVVLLRGLTL